MNEQQKKLLELKASYLVFKNGFMKRPFTYLAIIAVVVFLFNRINEDDKKTVEANSKNANTTTESTSNIPKGFSGWDGSNYALVKLVKDNMNDDGSFEHVETKMWNYDSFYIVKMIYKGKNGFNATVKETVRAKISKEDGSVIEVMPN